MQEPKDLFCLKGISFLCFNKDFTQCALTKKDENVYIYEIKNILDPKTWTEKYVLKHHIQYISGLDWNANTNRILTCSYDKMSAVWTFLNNKWSPENVVQNLKVGYLTCNWNSRGDKYVQGTSGKLLLVGYYNTDCKWWTSKKIAKTHKSSVVCAKFDPTSLYVISGSTDMRVCISSAYMKEIDDQFLNDDQKTNAKEFGTVIYTFEANSWICSVGFSPSGDYGLVGSQNATLNVIDYKNSKVDVINTAHSPISIILPTKENELYAIGFDRHIYSYGKEGDTWKLKKCLTRTGKKEEKPKETGNVTGFGGVAEQLKKYTAKGMVKKDSLAVKTDIVENVHMTSICSATVKDGKIITVDLAGFVKYWPM